MAMISALDYCAGRAGVLLTARAFFLTATACVLQAPLSTAMYAWHQYPVWHSGDFLAVRTLVFSTIVQRGSHMHYIQTFRPLLGRLHRNTKTTRSCVVTIPWVACMPVVYISYEVALGQYQDRVAAGLQPSTRVVNLYSVGTEEGLLVCANFLYLGLVVLLYLRMLVSSKACLGGRPA